ncbi:unnamed protein product [Ceutorhynchus assimilis]|uniref:RAP domain-containing protein n=1 Tax=Ceutorhynchus assimilis TaxID=467358 RepID=A0A9N9QRE5_9CUCU|nr:unnamed protein product [Ceutorhynchus assimilis]
MFTKKLMTKTLRAPSKPHSIFRELFACKAQYPSKNPQLLAQPLNLNQRQIRFCTVGTRQGFYDNENNFIFQIINRSSLIDNTLLDSRGKIIDEKSFTLYLSKDWRKSNATDIVKAFQTVKHYCISNGITVSDPRFDSLVDGLMDHCPKLTDNELLELLNCMAQYPMCQSLTEHNFHDMWSCLDDICCWKMQEWDIEKRFQIADAWYKLKLGKLIDYIFLLLDRHVKKAEVLSKDQLVRIFFYFNICRKRPVDFEYEFALEKKIHELSIDEMAVVALGYFKSQSKIKPEPIIEAMLNEVTNKAIGIHEITLTAIMKAVRFSFPKNLLQQIVIMLNALNPELDRLSETACLHVALVATSIQTFDADTLRKCSQKLVERLEHTRLKEIERLLNVLTMFSFDPNTQPDIFEISKQELLKESRINEITNHPRPFISALNYLSLKGVYNFKLLNRALDPEFIFKNFGKNAKMIPRELFSLDTCIDIECPDYKGNRLDTGLKYKCAKWQTEWAPSYDQFKKLSPKDKLFLDIKDLTEKIVGNKDFVMVQHVLPHFPSPDLIICKNTITGGFVKPEGLDRYILGDVMRPPKNRNLKWYALVALSWNNTMRNSCDILGHSAMKIRHLEKVGYTPVQIIWNQYMFISQEEKKKYILDKLI